MKRSELLFSVLLVPVDALMIFSAFLLAYYTRVESGALPVSYVLPLHQYVKIAAGFTVVWVLIFALLGLYQLRSTRRGLNEFSRILAGVSIGALAAIAVIFFGRQAFFSRLVIVFAFVASLILVTIARMVIRGLQQYFFRYGIGVRRVIIAGQGPEAQLLAAVLPSRGYRIIGLVGPRRGSETLGPVVKLAELVKRHRPDELINADSDLSDKAKQEIINIAEDYHVDLRLTSNIPELASSRLEVSAVAGIPLIEVKRTPLEGWGRVIKRLSDLTGSIVAMPFILAVYPFLAAAIRLDSRGPVLFKQTRVGRAGQTFTSYKFRSMAANAEKRLKHLKQKNELSGPVFKIKDDPRITRVGRFLRKTSLDELPQFFNVLKGEMSLVGPRPALPAEVKQYSRTERRRLTIKPGITGPWQVSGRSDVAFDEWVKLDVYYIQNWSLLLDVTILLKTVRAVITRRGAY